MVPAGEGCALQGARGQARAGVDDTPKIPDEEQPRRAGQVRIRRYVLPSSSNLQFQLIILLAVRRQRARRELEPVGDDWTSA